MTLASITTFSMASPRQDAICSHHHAHGCADFGCVMLPLTNERIRCGVLTFLGFCTIKRAANLVQDEVRPISCRGHDSQGGIAITLIDALDTLLVVALPTGCPSPSLCQSTMSSA